MIRIVAVSLAFLGIGCFDSLVALQCEEPLTECPSGCTDIRSDPQNCGACGVVCMSSCNDAVCVSGDSGGDDVVPGVVLFPRPTDPTPIPGCDLGETLCEAACVDTDRDPAHCGGCGVECASEEFCTNGRCIPDCEAPFVLCGNECVDPDSDQLHCGQCGTTCSSGVCSSGNCQDLGAGHVVYIGHDYSESNGAMLRALGNAAFAIPAHTGTILTYSEDSSPAQKSGVESALATEATERGMSVSMQGADAAEVLAALDNTSVLIVFPQGLANSETLAELGTLWQSALPAFTQRGGTLIILDGAGAHDGTHTVAAIAGLLGSGSKSEVTGEIVNLSAAGDSIASGLPLAYRAEATSVAISASEFVVATGSAGAVILHRVITPDND